MPASVTLKLDKRFVKLAKGRYEKFDFDVGILKDGIHRTALPSKVGLKSLAGGPARKVSLTPDGTLSDISEKLRKNTGINFYTAPFRSRNNLEILRFARSFFQLAAGRSIKKRCENLLQAIVRNPITRGDYGSNSPVTRKIKGFSRLMIDTGQIFKSIRARVNTRKVRNV